MTPQLTLNYGVRYEYQDPFVESNNNESNVDLASGLILLAGRGCNSRSLMTGRKDDIAPRIGFSYLVNNKISISTMCWLTASLPGTHRSGWAS